MVADASGSRTSILETEVLILKLLAFLGVRLRCVAKIRCVKVRALFEGNKVR